MFALLNIFAKPASKVEPNMEDQDLTIVLKQETQDQEKEVMSVTQELMERVSNLDDISVISITTIDTDDITWKTTIPFVPPINGGLVIKVYDGDTITIASKLPYEGSLMYRFQVRLNGIDSPGLKSKCDDERMMAKRAQKHLEQLILKKTVTLQNISVEKYGRVLADVYLGNIHINKYMLDNRFAVKYDGGTKKSPALWSDYYDAGLI